jgi:hypothetical protein
MSTQARWRANKNWANFGKMSHFRNAMNRGIEFPQQRIQISQQNFDRIQCPIKSRECIVSLG